MAHPHHAAGCTARGRLDVSDHHGVRRVVSTLSSPLRHRRGRGGRPRRPGRPRRASRRRARPSVPRQSASRSSRGRPRSSPSASPGRMERRTPPPTSRGMPWPKGWRWRSGPVPARSPRHRTRCFEVPRHLRCGGRRPGRRRGCGLRGRDRGGARGRRVRRGDSRLLARAEAEPDDRAGPGVVARDPARAVGPAPSSGGVEERPVGVRRRHPDARVGRREAVDPADDTARELLRVGHREPGRRQRLEPGRRVARGARVFTEPPVSTTTVTPAVPEHAAALAGADVMTSPASARPEAAAAPTR